MIYVDKPSILASLSGNELVELNQVNPTGETFPAGKVYATVNLIAAGAGFGPGGSNGAIQYNNSGSFGGFTVSGDGTLDPTTGTIIITKTNGMPFVASAVIDTTNANNISSGTLNEARLPVFGGDVLGGPGTASLTVTQINGSPLGSTTPTSGNLLIGSGTQWVTQTVSGDGTLSLSGTFTIANNAVTNAKFRQSVALSVVGNAGISTANVADIVGTANQVLRVNSAGTALAFGSVDISTASITGTLKVANGGTGQPTLTAHGVLIGEGTSGIVATAAMTSGQILVGQGATSDPTPQTVSGDATLAANGALAIASNAVTSAKFRQSVARSVVGNATNATANVTDIQGTANQVLVVNSGGTALGFGQVNLASTAAITGSLGVANGGTGQNTLTAHGVLIGEGTGGVVATAAMTAGQILVGQGATSDPLPETMSGDATLASSGALTIANSAVTNAKMANMANNTIKSNVSGGSASPSDNTLTSVLDTLGTTQGSVLYRDSNGNGGWLALSPGTSGNVLTTNGAGSNPSWSPASGGGGGGAPSFRNIIGMAGGLEVWQRGAGASASIAIAASTTAYTADRWYIITAASQASTVSAQAGITDGSRLCARVQRNSGQTGTGAMVFAIPLTTDEVAELRGSQVAISFTVSTGANWSPTSGTLTATFYTGTGTEGKRGGGFTGEVTQVAVSTNLTTSQSATRLTGVALSAAGSTITQGELRFTWTPTGTAGANDWFQLDDVQVEGASAATTFERLPFVECLLECQYHYTKTFPYSTSPANNAGVSGCAGARGILNFTTFVVFNIYYKFPVNLRASPTITTFNPSASNSNIRDFGANADLTANISANVKGATGVLVWGMNTTSATESDGGIHITADASL